MNMNLKGLEKKHETFIEESSLDDLKIYINNLAKDYFVSISKKNNETINLINEIFNNIIVIREDVPDINLYIEYALINAFNDSILTSTDSALDLNSIVLKEPILIVIGDKSENPVGFIKPSKLQNLLKCKCFKESDEITKKFMEQDPTAKDILEYLNYWKYKV